MAQNPQQQAQSLINEMGIIAAYEYAHDKMINGPDWEKLFWENVVKILRQRW